MPEEIEVSTLEDLAKLEPVEDGATISQEEFDKLLPVPSPQAAELMRMSQETGLPMSAAEAEDFVRRRERLAQTASAEDFVRRREQLAQTASNELAAMRRMPLGDVGPYAVGRALTSDFGKGAIKNAAEIAGAAALGPAGPALGAATKGAALARAFRPAVRGAIGAAGGNVFGQGVTEGTVDLWEALYTGGLEGVFSYVPASIKNLFNKRALDKAIKSEGKMLEALKPPTKELDVFSEKPVRHLINEARYKTDLFSEPAKLADEGLAGLRDRLMKKIGGTSPKTGKQIQGTLGVKLAGIGDELNKLPETRVRFSDLKNEIDDMVLAKTARQRVSGEADKIIKLVDEQTAELKKRHVAKKFFPKARTNEEAIGKLDELLGKYESSLTKTQEQIDKLQASGTTGKRLEHAQGQRNKLLAEYDSLKAEMDNPILDFNDQWEMQKSFDIKAANSFDTQLDQLTPEGQAAVIVANSARATTANSALRAGDQELGQAFLNGKREYELYKSLEHIVGRAEGTLSKTSEERVRTLSKFGVTVNIPGLGGGRRQRDEYFKQAMKMQAESPAIISELFKEVGEQQVAPMVELMPRALTSPPRIIASRILDPSPDNFTDPSMLEAVTTELLIQNGFISRPDAKKGVSTEQIPLDQLNTIQEEAKALISEFQLVSDELGPRHPVTINSASQLSQQFPQLFKTRSGIPGEVKVGEKRILPAPEQRQMYSVKIKEDPTLSPWQKAQMRSALNRDGEVIKAPKPLKRISSRPARASIQEGVTD